jgi:hypothetical protein
MIHRVILTAMLLAAAPVVADEPSEQTKRDALILGYALNGNSMVRWGSIDVSSLINPMAPYVPRAIPLELYGPPAPPDLGRVR